MERLIQPPAFQFKGTGWHAPAPAALAELGKRKEKTEK